MLIMKLLVKYVAPSDGGFWDIGNFNSQVGAVDNPWRHGNKMASFDQPVSIFLLNFEPFT
jgi:hypothetical protein